MFDKTLKVTPTTDGEYAPLRIFQYADGHVVVDRLPLTSPIPRSAQVVSAWQYPHAVVTVEVD